MQEFAGGTVEPSLPDHFPRHARICASGSKLQAVHQYFWLFVVDLCGWGIICTSTEWSGRHLFEVKDFFIPHGYHWTALMRAEGFTWLRDFNSCHTEYLSFGWSFTILHPCARPHPRLSHCASQLAVWNRFPLSLMQFVGKCTVSLNNRSGLREKQHTWDPLSLHNYCAILCRTRISFEPSIYTYKKTFLYCYVLL